LGGVCKSSGKLAPLQRGTNAWSGRAAGAGRGGWGRRRPRRRSQGRCGAAAHCVSA
jgi:hypothetical protein